MLGNQCLNKMAKLNIRNGIYAGMPLSQLWNEHPELFANNESH